MGVAVYVYRARVRVVASTWNCLLFVPAVYLWTHVGLLGQPS